MKQIIIFILSVVMVIVSIIGIKYMDYKQGKKSIILENLEYETYLNKNVTGIEVTTIINRAVNSNTINSIPKDEQGFYILNDSNSIEVEIKMMDDENNIYKMETIYNGGMENFIQYYREISFECTKIEYNRTGRVSYIVFEQKTN